MKKQGIQCMDLYTPSTLGWIPDMYEARLRLATTENSV